MLATLLPAPDPTALNLFESLCNVSLDPSVVLTAGNWIDCATRLDIAASSAYFAGQAGQCRKLRGRADECRARARRLAVIEVRS